VELFLLLSATIVVVVGVAWWLRRRQHDLGEFVDESYDGPPPVHGQSGPH
jgi:hypothetical protein